MDDEVKNKMINLLEDYIFILLSIVNGASHLEFKRQDIHNEIAKLLECNRENISPVLHNIDIYSEDENIESEIAETLLKLKEENLI